MWFRISDWLLQVRSSNGVLTEFNAKSFRKSRSSNNQEAFETVLQHFAPCVVGKTLYRKRLQMARKEEDLWTVSDEAFVYLVLENTYDRWLDIFSQNHQANKSPPTLGTERRWFSDVPTKFTEGGMKYSEGAIRQQDKGVARGWSKAGLERYNKLFRGVKKERMANPRLFREWITRKQAEGIRVPMEKKRAKKVGGIAMETDLYRRMGIKEGDEEGLEVVDDHSSDEDDSDNSLLSDGGSQDDEDREARHVVGV